MFEKQNYVDASEHKSCETRIAHLLLIRPFVKLALLGPKQRCHFHFSQEGKAASSQASVVTGSKKGWEM